ncbi:hypothetical protein JG687_00014364 [Phytophthora cactorum]|uniref:Uncharacterized protein n=2 Tax=Phytophthora cactorum TaxID=29920 RepID=A0A329RZC1_9STRA|nr:hypothetical protein PC112_g14877 [Phytophthora cactorum]KAG2814830.1 hypothetical protein PC111_g13803 [Phytophthora cactorum]KAG2893486.1 hypothetical protein PC114_g16241 [Phytophthora cactorum]KAG2923621.1 hypothetical protein PC117_g15676 [Phytophthora cactorum]KAG3001744.1 hypothetical protein PC120_g20093 [Phytophthora cactorum]
MVVRVNFHVAYNRNAHYREMFLRAGDAASVPVVVCRRTQCGGCGHGYENECDVDCGSGCDHEAVAQP